MSYEAKKYRAYARECLQLAEKAASSQVREKLIALSRVWMEAASNEDRHSLSGLAGPRAADAR
jgi:hypothetical protein